MSDFTDDVDVLKRLSDQVKQTRADHTLLEIINWEAFRAAWAGLDEPTGPRKAGVEDFDAIAKRLKELFPPPPAEPHYTNVQVVTPAAGPLVAEYGSCSECQKGQHPCKGWCYGC